MANADSSDDTLSGRAEIEALAKAWELSISDTLEWLAQHAEEQQVHEPEYDEEPLERLPSSALASDNTDQAIDRLFLSLGNSVE